MSKLIKTQQLETKILPPIKGYIDNHSVPNGGTTGQALVKKSDADQDVEWADQPVIVGSDWGVAKTGSANIPVSYEETAEVTVDISDMNFQSSNDFMIAITGMDNYIFCVPRIEATSFKIRRVGASTSSNTWVHYTIFAKGYGSTPSGGTTGQVLAKKSNADGDVEWKDVGGGSYTAGDGIDITNDVISNKIKLEYNSLTGNNVLISQQGATLFDNIGLQFNTNSQAQSTTLTYVKGLPVGGVSLAHTGYVDNKWEYATYNNEWTYRINGNSFEAIYNVNRTLAIDTAEGALFRSAAQTLTVPTAFLQGKTLTIKSFSANLMKSGAINWVTADNINDRSVTWYAISPTSKASDTYALSVVIKGILS